MLTGLMQGPDTVVQTHSLNAVSKAVLRRRKPMHGISTSNLLKLPLFRGLTTEELSKLNRHLRLKAVSAGGSITLAGQSIQEIYIILKGVVHIQLDQANGTPVILAILEPGDLVDITSLVGKIVYLTSAVAKEDT